MSMGRNLQFLRKMRNGMTQEELAEKMGVSRQTVSKWELDAAYPEIDKAIELCGIFSCSLDQLLREDMSVCSEAYSDMRIKEVAPFRYVRYTVISGEPESDAIGHMKAWATAHGMDAPEIVGWDFPYVAPEQISVYHMHGYAAACILPEGFEAAEKPAGVIFQKKQKYAVVTIRDPLVNAFSRIPNAYKALASYMQVNGVKHKQVPEVLPCFEKEYDKDGVHYMDVYIAADL